MRKEIKQVSTTFIEFNEEEINILLDICRTDIGVPRAVNNNIPKRKVDDVFKFLKELYCLF